MGKKRDTYLAKRAEVRSIMDDIVAAGGGKPRAIREMFKYAIDKNICDPAKWFPGFKKALERSEAQKLWSIGKLAERPVAKVRYTFQNLLIMGELIGGRGNRKWIMLPRSCAYTPSYEGKESEIVFYPFVALVVEAYLSMRSPKAWDTRGCSFGLRDQQWFEQHSVAYKNIINEFGSSALPSCFI